MFFPKLSALFLCETSLKGERQRRFDPHVRPRPIYYDPYRSCVTTRARHLAQYLGLLMVLNFTSFDPISLLKPG